MADPYSFLPNMMQGGKGLGFMDSLVNLLPIAVMGGLEYFSGANQADAASADAEANRAFQASQADADRQLQRDELAQRLQIAMMNKGGGGGGGAGAAAAMKQAEVASRRNIVEAILGASGQEQSAIDRFITGISGAYRGLPQRR